MWNKEVAIKYLNSHAHVKSHHLCGRYTREAIEAGGITLIRHDSAKDYGPSLRAAGFEPVTDTGAYLPGDVVVIDGFPGSTDGHMAMFNGENWVSDFVQRELYPGSGYKAHRPGYTIYRKR
jgi:hypothetical protein